MCGKKHLSREAGGIAAMVAAYAACEKEGWRRTVSEFRGKKQVVGLSLRRGVGVGDGERASGSHRRAGSGQGRAGQRTRG